MVSTIHSWHQSGLDRAELVLSQWSEEEVPSGGGASH